MNDIFISHSYEDSEEVLKLKLILEAEGFFVWGDHDLQVGKNWKDEISAIINVVDAIFVLWTESSIKSKNVLAEARRAFEQNKLIPLTNVDFSKLPLEFSTIQTMDVKDLLSKSNAKSLKSIKEAVSAKTTSSVNESANHIGPVTQLESDLSQAVNEKKESDVSNFKENHPDSLLIIKMLEERLQHVPKKGGIPWLGILSLLIALPSLWVVWPTFYSEIKLKVIEPSLSAIEKLPENELSIEDDVSSIKKILTEVDSTQLKINTYYDLFKGKKIPATGWLVTAESLPRKVSTGIEVDVKSYPNGHAIQINGGEKLQFIRPKMFLKISGTLGKYPVKRFYINDAEAVRATAPVTNTRSKPSNSHERCVQRKLRDLGYYNGRIDGVIGVQTERAKANFFEDISRTTLSVRLGQENYQVLCSDLTEMDTVSSDVFKQLAINRAIEDKWQEVTKAGTVSAFYKFIRGDFDDVSSARKRYELNSNSLYKTRKEEAKKFLGISFEPPPNGQLVLLSKDGVTYPFSYRVNVELGVHGNSIFHNGEDLHGVSECLTHSQMNQCAADGVCSFTNKASGNQCVISTKENMKKLCPQFSEYINRTFGHNSRAFWNDECTLHYSRKSLNKIISP